MMERCITLFINKKRFVKKLLGIYILSIIFIRSLNVYGESVHTSIDFELCNIFLTIDDVYCLNDEYLKNPDLTVEEADKLLNEYALNYVDIEYIYGKGFYYDIVGKEGYIDYSCCTEDPMSSAWVKYPQAVLKSYWTGEVIFLNEPREKIEQFIECTNQIAEQTREKLFYVRNNLKDTEYASVYYDDKYQVHVMLADESKAFLLEEHGIIWEKTDTSLADKYAKLQYLWEERETLNIIDVYAYTDIDKLVICRRNSEEEFRAKLNDRRFQNDFYNRMDEIDDTTTSDTPEEFIKKKEQTYLGLESNQWEKIKQYLEQMSLRYPEYSYENLFSFVFQDCNYKDYVNFDKNLEQFTDSVKYYKNEKNPFDEKYYGDSGLIALKMFLANYKSLYPEMSYEKLYDKYGKEINESEILTQEEKRSKYLWKIVQAKQLIRGKKQQIYPAIVGFGILIISCGIVIILKEKRKDKMEKKI